MKRICLMLAVWMLLLGAAGALAQKSDRASSERKKEFNIWDVDFDHLTDEDEKEIERLKEEAKQDRLKKMRDQAVPKEKDYDQNTVCSFGPKFREVSPRMTDAWYMFTPVDLSREGTQTYDLIAGNMFVVGQVRVTVGNGKFQVDYTYNSSDIVIGREYFTIFTDYEDITAKNFDHLHQQKRFSYGKAYSIADKLGGDTDVILFVCNTTTFQKTGRGIMRYYSTNPERVEMREEMLDMIGK